MYASFIEPGRGEHICERAWSGSGFHQQFLQANTWINGNPLIDVSKIDVHVQLLDRYLRHIRLGSGRSEKNTVKAYHISAKRISANPSASWHEISRRRAKGVV